MAQVRWSLTAGNDLQDIEDFIARDSVLHAVAFVDRIVENAQTLLKNSRIGRVVPDSAERSRTLPHPPGGLTPRKSL